MTLLLFWFAYIFSVFKMLFNSCSRKYREEFIYRKEDPLFCYKYSSSILLLNENGNGMGLLAMLVKYNLSSSDSYNNETFHWECFSIVLHPAATILSYVTFTTTSNWPMLCRRLIHFIQINPTTSMVCFLPPSKASTLRKYYTLRLERLLCSELINALVYQNVIKTTIFVTIYFFFTPFHLFLPFSFHTYHKLSLFKFKESEILVEITAKYFYIWKNKHVMFASLWNIGIY